MGIKAEVKGDILHIMIDVSEAAKAAAAPSKSGKTRVLATTSGFTSYGAGVKISLNATVDL